LLVNPALSWEEIAMLDLEALVTDLKGLAGDVVRSAERTQTMRREGAAQLGRLAGMEGLREAIGRFRPDMAMPVPGRDPAGAFPAPEVGDYTVIATDGSQIPPDYHHVVPWYLIHAGCAVFRYGPPPGRERCRLSAHAHLKPQRTGAADPTAEVAGEEGADADARAATATLPGGVEIERLKAELELAARLLDEEGDPGRTVLLLDGPLVQWRMVHLVRDAAARAELVELFRGLLEQCRETRTPVAGFISRSRAVELVTLLRFSLCPEVAAGRDLCPECQRTLLERSEPTPAHPHTPSPTHPRTRTPTHPHTHTPHHASLADLRDVEVAGEPLTERGWRTEVLELKSKVWAEITGGSGTAGFFYLNAGAEIARVELPSWVWEDDALMELLHGALYDQCHSGLGYPMVLAEAHEQAVVRGADREAFYLLIERILIEHGWQGATTSAKALSKRRPSA
jgi:hypothetical protein